MYCLVPVPPACGPGFYGAGCRLTCECGDMGKCDRFRGCVCKGRHGARCEREDRAPVVVSNLIDTELNAGIHHIVNCSATGRPAPLHREIILLKPDTTRIYAFDTDMVDDQTTSTFRVDKITERDTGRWICQVKTPAGQAQRYFMVIVQGKKITKSNFPKTQIIPSFRLQYFQWIISIEIDF
eukprot:XP_014038755.1 PREDICTED: tyrosine-protein kinase receptor Tie-2-like [Salmo salar]